MSTTIFLLRHAAYENPKKIMHGRLSGFPLSEIGKKQAHQLANELGKIKLAAVYASPLTRAQQTAEYIAKAQGLKVITNDLLIDIKTPLQGKPLVVVQKEDGNFYQEKYIKQGGERLEDVYGRIDKVFDEIFIKFSGEAVAVVTHGDHIMSMRSMVLEGKLPKYYSMTGDYVGMGKGYVLKYSESGSVCIAPLVI